MKEHLNEKFIAALKYIDPIIKKDKANGNPWKYTNKKKRYEKFEQARSHNRLTNCVSGVQFGLLMIGMPSGINHWYGAGGNIVYTTAKGRATVPKYFDVIKVNDTVQNLRNKGKLCDGDILIYQNMNHTNVYLGGNKSYDSGHHYCSSGGEMAVFNKFIGSLAYKTAKVGTILRFKDRAHYRVQCGAFKSQGSEYNALLTKLNKAGYKTMLVQEDGLFKVSIGYFSGKTNADDYATKVVAKGFPAIVVEASNAKAIEVTPDSDPIPNPSSTPTPTPTENKVYRVQVGVFKTVDARNKTTNDVKSKTGFDTFYELKNRQYYLYCGSFTKKAKAEERSQILTKNNIDCLIKEFQI